MSERSVARRVFVKAGGLALVSLGIDPMFLTRAAYAVDCAGAGPVKKTLVCIFQRGAVDGLNMIVPHGDEFYYRERSRIAIPAPGRERGSIDLDGYFGLHPELGALAPLYRAGTLAIVHAVGSHHATRSHFDAQDYMETGTPGLKVTPDGWLNRHLAHAHEHSDTPFRGVALGSQLPRILRGSAPALAIPNLQSFGFGRGQRTTEWIATAFETLYAGSSTGLVASSSQEAFEAIRMLKSSNLDSQSAQNGAEYPPGSFGRSMRQIAQLVKANLGLEIAFTDIGGWDTHVNQGASEGQLAARLREFGDTLAAFSRDLGERMSDVVVLTMSEFGRTIAENGSAGTDHGHATAMMVMGGDVIGGNVYGRWPTLDPARRFEGRDLAVTTDFRDLFSEVLVRHLGATNLPAVFPGHRADADNWLGLFGT